MPQLDGRHAAGGGERVTGPGDDHVRVVREGLEGERRAARPGGVRGRRCAASHEREVHVAVEHAACEFLARQHHHLHGDARRTLPELGEQRRQDVRARAEDAEVQRAVVALLERVEVLVEQAEPDLHVAGGIGDPLAHHREAQLAAQPVEDRGAQRFLELLHLLGNRRAGHVQRRRGAGHGAEVGDRADDLQLPQAEMTHWHKQILMVSQ